MRKLPNGTANSDVSDLERIERYIDPAPRYAWMLWHASRCCGHGTRSCTDNHPHPVSVPGNEVFVLAGVFSILGAAKNAVKALQVATDWLKVVEFLYFMSYLKSLKLDPGITSA